MTDSAPHPRVEDLLAQATWVTKLVRSMVRDADLADDVVQDTMLRAIEKAPRAHDGPGLRSWLAIVSRRLALRRLRSEAVRRRREATVAAQGAIDPAQIEERVLLQRALATEVLNLDETHRMAVILCYQDGLSAKEIASRLGISHAAARQRISRGVTKLRQRLEQQHGKGRRGWMAAFGPLLCGPVAPPLPGTSYRLWISGAAASFLVVAGVFWWVGHRPSDSALPREVASATPSPRENRDTVAPPERTPVAPRVPVASDDPVIDRERDLHGRVVDTDGRPIPGARIEASRVDEAAYRANVPTPAPPLAYAISNESGEFAIRLARDAVVDLRIHADTYGGELLPYRRAGERVEVAMAPAAGVLGRVVRSSDGQPIPGSPVRFVRFWFADGVSRCIGQTVTGPDGEFSILALPPCRLAVEVATPGEACRPTVLAIEAGGTFRPTIEVGPGRAVRGMVRDGDSGQPIAGATVVGSYAQLATTSSTREPSALAVARSWAPAFERSSDATGRFEVRVPVDFTPVQVRVAAAGYASATIAVPPDRTPELAVSLRRGWSLAGRVVGPDGVAMPNARVVALATAAIEGVERGDCSEAVTDVSGRFRIECLCDDLRYHIGAYHPNLAGRFVEVVRQSGATAVDLGDLTLAVPATVRGVVVGNDDVPKPGVFLAFETESGDVVARVRSDDAGRFSAAGLPPGRVMLRSGCVQEPLDLLPGVERDDVRILLAHDGIFGEVTDMSGTPIHNALVLLVDSAGTGSSRNIVSGPDGRFEFDGVSPGSYSIRAAPNSISLPGGDRMVHQVRLDGIGPSPVELRVVLPPASATRGVVVDSDGKPLGRTLVFARRPDGGLVTYEVSAPDGTFLLRLPPGEVVDLAVGKEAPHRIVIRGVKAGDGNVRVVRERSPK